MYLFIFQNFEKEMTTYYAKYFGCSISWEPWLQTLKNRPPITNLIVQLCSCFVITVQHWSARYRKDRSSCMMHYYGCTRE
jgi:hypothetical protein